SRVDTLSNGQEYRLRKLTDEILPGIAQAGRDERKARLEREAKDRVENRQADRKAAAERLLKEVAPFYGAPDLKDKLRDRSRGELLEMQQIIRRQSNELLRLSDPSRGAKAAKLSDDQLHQLGQLGKAREVIAALLRPSSASTKQTIALSEQTAHLQAMRPEFMRNLTGMNPEYIAKRLREMSKAESNYGLGQTIRLAQQERRAIHNVLSNKSLYDRLSEQDRAHYEARQKILDKEIASLKEATKLLAPKTTAQSKRESEKRYQDLLIKQGQGYDERYMNMYAVPEEHREALKAYKTAQLQETRSSLTNIAERLHGPGSLKLTRNEVADLRKEEEKLHKVQNKLNKELRELADASKVAHPFMQQLGRTLAGFMRYAFGYAALYRVTQTIRDMISATVGLEARLKEIQAITGSTTQDMADLSMEIRRIATTSAFDLQDITAAVKLISQAGIELSKIPQYTQAVAQLATASGSSLQVAADVITTAATVWDNLSPEQIADRVTQAANVSKLAVEDLQTIFSLGASFAKGANVELDQYMGMVSLLRNVGVRQTTIGTGGSQLMLELFTPDKQFQKFMESRYKAIGEPMSREDVAKRFSGYRYTDNPLFYALAELKRVGADSPEASIQFERALDKRAINVLRPLLANFEKLSETTERLRTGITSYEASRIAMDSVEKALINFHDSLKALTVTMTEDAMPALGDAIRSVTSGLHELDRTLLGVKLRGGDLGGTAFGGVAGTILGGWLGSRAGGANVGLRLFKTLFGSVVGAAGGAAIGKEADEKGGAFAGTVEGIGLGALILSIAPKVMKGVLDLFTSTSSSWGNLGKKSLAGRALTLLQAVPGWGKLLASAAVLASTIVYEILDEAKEETKKASLKNQLKLVSSERRAKLQEVEENLKGYETFLPGGATQLQYGEFQRKQESLNALLSGIGGKPITADSQIISTLTDLRKRYGDQQSYSRLKKELATLLDVPEKAIDEKMLPEIMELSSSVDGYLNGFFQNLREAHLRLLETTSPTENEQRYLGYIEAFLENDAEFKAAYEGTTKSTEVLTRSVTKFLKGTGEYAKVLDERFKVSIDAISKQINLLRSAPDDASTLAYVSQIQEQIFEAVKTYGVLAVEAIWDNQEAYWVEQAQAYLTRNKELTSPRVVGKGRNLKVIPPSGNVPVDSRSVEQIAQEMRLAAAEDETGRILVDSLKKVIEQDMADFTEIYKTAQVANQASLTDTKVPPDIQNLINNLRQEWTLGPVEEGKQLLERLNKLKTGQPVPKDLYQEILAYAKQPEVTLGRVGEDGTDNTVLKRGLDSRFKVPEALQRYIQARGNDSVVTPEKINFRETEAYFKAQERLNQLEEMIDLQSRFNPQWLIDSADDPSLAGKGVNPLDERLRIKKDLIEQEKVSIAGQDLESPERKRLLAQLEKDRLNAEKEYADAIAKVDKTRIDLDAKQAEADAKAELTVIERRISLLDKLRNTASSFEELTRIENELGDLTEDQLEAKRKIINARGKDSQTIEDLSELEREAVELSLRRKDMTALINLIRRQRDQAQATPADGDFVALGARQALGHSDTLANASKRLDQDYAREKLNESELLGKIKESQDALARNPSDNEKEILNQGIRDAQQELNKVRELLGQIGVYRADLNPTIASEFDQVSSADIASKMRDLPGSLKNLDKAISGRIVNFFDNLAGSLANSIVTLTGKFLGLVGTSQEVIDAMDKLREAQYDQQEVIRRGSLDTAYEIDYIKNNVSDPERQGYLINRAMEAQRNQELLAQQQVDAAQYELDQAESADSFGGQFQNLVKETTAGLAQDMLKGVFLQSFSGLFERGSSAMNPTYTHVVNMGGGAGDTKEDGKGGIFSPIVDTFKGWLGMDSPEAAITNGEGKDIASQVTDGVSEAVDGEQGWFSKITSGFTGMFDNLWGNIDDLFSGISLTLMNILQPQPQMSSTAKSLMMASSIVGMASK
ncbi:MAG: phage tail tape measure protein, partial [Leptolyngbyaceae bacterium]|nr:phage tail tape measure protein [Leptolyngbyaceae bacterium]